MHRKLSIAIIVSALLSGSLYGMEKEVDEKKATPERRASSLTVLTLPKAVCEHRVRSASTPSPHACMKSHVPDVSSSTSSPAGSGHTSRSYSSDFPGQQFVPRD